MLDWSTLQIILLEINLKNVGMTSIQVENVFQTKFDEFGAGKTNKIFFKLKN